MINKSVNSFNGSKYSGLTLIEVVAATTLLATLLVSMLSIFSHHQKQLVRGSQLKQAVQAMDLLLSDWYSSSAGLPQSERFPAIGPCQQHPQFFWHAGFIDLPNSLPLPDTLTLRVSIYDHQNTKNPVTHVDLAYAIE